MRALEQVVDVVATLRALGLGRTGEHLDVYADAALRLAEHDLAHAHRQDDRAPTGPPGLAVQETVAALAVLGEVLFAAMHRLARQAVAASKPGA